MVFPFTQGTGRDSCCSIRHAVSSRDSELPRAKIPRSPSGMATARRHGSVGHPVAGAARQASARCRAGGGGGTCPSVSPSVRLGRQGMTRLDGTTEGTTIKKSVVPRSCRRSIPSNVDSNCVVGPNPRATCWPRRGWRAGMADPSKRRRPLPPSPPPVHCKSEGVSDPTRRLQSRPRGHPGSLTPSVSPSRDAVAASVLWGELVASTCCSDRASHWWPSRPANREPTCVRSCG